MSTYEILEASGGFKLSFANGFGHVSTSIQSIAAVLWEHAQAGDVVDFPYEKDDWSALDRCLELVRKVVSYSRADILVTEMSPAGVLRTRVVSKVKDYYFEKSGDQWEVRRGDAPLRVVLNHHEPRQLLEACRVFLRVGDVVLFNRKHWGDAVFAAHVLEESLKTFKKCLRAEPKRTTDYYESYVVRNDEVRMASTIKVGEAVRTEHTHQIVEAGAAGRERVGRLQCKEANWQNLPRAQLEYVEKDKVLTWADVKAAVETLADHNIPNFEREYRVVGRIHDEVILEKMQHHTVDCVTTANGDITCANNCPLRHKVSNKERGSMHKPGSVVTDKDGKKFTVYHYDDFARVAVYLDEKGKEVRLPSRTTWHHTKSLTEDESKSWVRNYELKRGVEGVPQQTWELFFTAMVESERGFFAADVPYFADKMRQVVTAYEEARKRVMKLK